MYNFIVVEFEPGGSRHDLFGLKAWRATLAEFVGTLIFVFVSAGAVVTSGLAQEDRALDPARILVISLAHGLPIALLVGSLGSISGGHFNPVITLAFIITGRISIVRGIMYGLGQFFGSIVGAGLLKAVVLGTEYGILGSHSVTHVAPGQALVVEILCTFMLIITVYGTAVDLHGPGIVSSLLIGTAISAAHLVAVPLTGCSMNPARSFGPAVWSGYWRYHWVYWLGPTIGSVLATMFYVHGLKGGVRDVSLPGHLAGIEEASSQSMGEGNWDEEKAKAGG